MGRHAFDDCVDYRCNHPEDDARPLFAPCHVNHEVCHLEWPIIHRLTLRGFILPVSRHCPASALWPRHPSCPSGACARTNISRANWPRTASSPKTWPFSPNTLEASSPRSSPRKLGTASRSPKFANASSSCYLCPPRYDHTARPQEVERPLTAYGQHCTGHTPMDLGHHPLPLSLLQPARV